MSTTKVPVVYVSGLAAWGFLNGIINVAFTTAAFLPEPVQNDKGGWETKVVAAEEVSANLRLDLFVAQQLHAALGKIIEDNTKPKVMDS